MVVDDDAAIRDIFQQVLADEGYDVLLAGNGREALSQLRSGQRLPCLIFLDLMMPVMDGHAFRAEQVQDAAIAGIPTIAVTAGGGHGPPGIEVLHKPFRLDAVLAALRRHCGTSGGSLDRPQ